MDKIIENVLIKELNIAPSTSGFYLLKTAIKLGLEGDETFRKNMYEHIQKLHNKSYYAVVGGIRRAISVAELADGELINKILVKGDILSTIFLLTEEIKERIRGVKENGQN